ncbi:MAG: SusD/RagB family nutrient-binding outer membrane lipoprotein, partial [Bacteroidia bacterium]
MKKLFVIIMGIALSFTGCDISDFGDTNENVNGPLEGNTASLLSGAMTRFSTQQGRPYRITPTLNVQYFMQVVYNDEMLYADYSGFWQSYYVQVLSNLKLVIDIVSDPESALDPAIVGNGNLANQKAVAMIFKAVVFKRVTDLFGDVPYSNALTAETLTPLYDKQEDIYAAMIADVKAARDMILVGNAGPTGDAIYGGDMTKWVKFANSFLMQMAMQLSEVTSSKIDAEAEFASALGHSGGVIETLDEEAWYSFDTQNGFNNPWNWMRPADYGVAEELISSLKGYGNNAVTSNTTFDDRILVMQEDTS